MGRARLTGFEVAGKGVTVAVVDSGVNASYQQLRGRVAGQADLTHRHPTHCYGHGTMVAGVIGGQDLRNAKPLVDFLGVAPDVLLAAGIRKAAYLKLGRRRRPGHVAITPGEWSENQD